MEVGGGGCEMFKKPTPACVFAYRVTVFTAKFILRFHTTDADATNILEPSLSKIRFSSSSTDGWIIGLSYTNANQANDHKIPRQPEEKGKSIEINRSNITQDIRLHGHLRGLMTQSLIPVSECLAMELSQLLAITKKFSNPNFTGQPSCTRVFVVVVFVVFFRTYRRYSCTPSTSPSTFTSANVSSGISRAFHGVSLWKIRGVSNAYV